jgi:hypothetical protein
MNAIADRPQMNSRGTRRLSTIVPSGTGRMLYTAEARRWNGSTNTPI